MNLNTVHISKHFPHKRDTKKTQNYELALKTICNTLYRSDT